MRKSEQTKNMVYIAMMAVLICVCSWITVPGAVPFTMQTFGVFCTLRLLGGKRGSAVIALYILLGCIGLPVFSGFNGGLRVLLGATGGYITGFLLLALIYWLLTKLFGNGNISTVLALLAGLLVCYAFGTVWFVTLYTHTSGNVSVMTALGWCVFPFVIPDIIKLVLALSVAKLVKNHVRL